jgi:hypothetical protein
MRAWQRETPDANALTPTEIDAYRKCHLKRVVEYSLNGHQLTRKHQTRRTSKVRASRSIRALTGAAALHFGKALDLWWMVDHRTGTARAELMQADVRRRKGRTPAHTGQQGPRLLNKCDGRTSASRAWLSTLGRLRWVWKGGSPRSRGMMVTPRKRTTYCHVSRLQVESP